MLLVKSRRSNQSLTLNQRKSLLDGLTNRGLKPLIRSARLTLFSQMSTDPDFAEFAESCLSSDSSEIRNAYFTGDLFLFDDYALYMTFGPSAEFESSEAGIVYSKECSSPDLKLEVFKKNIEDLCDPATGEPQNGPYSDFESKGPAISFDAFELHGECPQEATVQTGVWRQAALWCALAGNPEARALAAKLSAAYQAGRIKELLISSDPQLDSSRLMDMMEDAGMVKREILVSCRKVRRPLFRLAAETLNNRESLGESSCKFCGESLAVERIDELLIPTDLAKILFDERMTQVSSVSSQIMNLGVDESEIKIAYKNGIPYLRFAFSEELIHFVFLGAMRPDLGATDMIPSRGSVIYLSDGELESEDRKALSDRFQASFEDSALHFERTDRVAANLHLLLSGIADRRLETSLVKLDKALGFSAAGLLTARFMRTLDDPGVFYPAPISHGVPTQARPAMS
jgi:hypothetical protein